MTGMLNGTMLNGTKFIGTVLAGSGLTRIDGGEGS